MRVIIMLFRAQAHSNSYDDTRLSTCDVNHLPQRIFDWERENEGRSLDQKDFNDGGGIISYDSGEAIMIWQKEE